MLDPQAVQSMATDDFFIHLGLAMVASGGCFYGVFRFLRRARLIEDTPTSKIRSAAQGFVELIGFGSDAEQMVSAAPLTGKTCLWWRYKIEKYRGHGKNSRWETIEKRTSDEHFQLDDGTGLCVIDPQGAEVVCDIRQVWRGTTHYPAKTPGNSLFLSGIFGGNYRYTEERIHVGEQLYALGFLHTYSPGESFDVKAATRDILRVWKQDYQALLQRFDGNGDGEFDLEEWCRVQQAALREAQQSQRQEQARAPINILAKPPSSSYPYILATKEQQGLARRFRLYAFGCTAVFFVAGAYAMWLGINRF